jgi:hypothetical protein
MKREFVAVLLISLCMATLTACGSFAETPGERFRKAMKEIEAACEKRKLGPNEVCGEVAKLKPADPLATEEGRFAHSIRIPNPVPADSGYKPGMTPQDYFDHLCKTEAGEFIYRTVENVEGIYIMRPRKEATDSELSHLYALEDPYGQVLGESRLPQNSYVQPALGKYEFMEMPALGSQKKYRRYYRDENAHPGRKYQTAINGKSVLVPYIVAEAEVPMTKSHFGYTWRGVARPYDRDMGIAGGELIILDIETNEVVAVRRGYIRSGSGKNITGIWWLAGQVCSEMVAEREHLFVKQVLRPTSYSETGRGR